MNFLYLSLPLVLKKKKNQEHRDFVYFVRSEVKRIWTILGDAIDSLTENYNTRVLFLSLDVFVEFFFFFKNLFHDNKPNELIQSVETDYIT